MSSNQFVAFSLALFVIVGGFMMHVRREVQARRKDPSSFAARAFYRQIDAWYELMGEVPASLAPYDQSSHTLVAYLPLDNAWIICGLGPDGELGTTDDACFTGPFRYSQ